MLAPHRAGATGKEEKLAQALRDGIIDEHEYQTKMLAARNSGPSAGTGQLTTAPTQVLQGSGKVVMKKCMPGLWSMLAGPYATQTEAVQALRKSAHGGNEAHWARNNTGDGSKKNWHCNHHIACPVQVRVRQVLRQWYLEVLNVQHSLQPKMFRRANSSLSQEDEAVVYQQVAKGAKPRDIMEGLQAERAEEGWKKDPSGGIVGAPTLQPQVRNTAVRITRSGGWYRSCIVPRTSTYHIYHMYISPVCIVRACIMYIECTTGMYLMYVMYDMNVSHVSLVCRRTQA